MASPLTHALVGATLAVACHFPWKLWVVGVASALLPDLDAAGYWLGVLYGSFWGHRGFTHSMVFAVLASGLFARWIGCWTGMTVVRVWTCCVVAMLSHGILDAMTDGGLGVAILLADGSEPLLPADSSDPCRLDVSARSFRPSWA